MYGILAIVFVLVLVVVATAGVTNLLAGRRWGTVYATAQETIGALEETLAETAGRNGTLVAQSVKKDLRIAELEEALAEEKAKVLRYFEGADRAVSQKQEWADMYHAALVRFGASQELMLREISRLSNELGRPPRPVFRAAMAQIEAQSPEKATNTAVDAVAQSVPVNEG